MEKDFDKWNELKKKTNLKTDVLVVRNREVWWCSLGLNIGSEQDGGGESFERPVIVLRKFTRNTFLGIPVTSKKKLGNYYFTLKPYFGVTSYAILSQARIIDRKRLKRIIYELSYQEFREIIKQYKELF